MTSHPEALGIPLTVVGDQPDCLPQIFRDDVNLAIWKRSVDPTSTSFVANFTDQAGQLERFAGLSEGEGAGEVLPRWAHGLAGVDAWIRDVNELLDMFRCLFEPASVGLRIHVLRGTMCPRFHADRVPVRLLCTYQGDGTEWLPEPAVLRPVDSGPLPDQDPLPHQIQRLDTGDVALLKGEAWVGNEGRGVVHRSPAPGTGARLVIALDWLSD